MDFEDILKDVGGFGLYQKVLGIVFLLPSFTVIPWILVNHVFNINTPEHWCYVPDVAESNLSLDIQKMLIRPLNDHSCSMYDVNYSLILSSGNFTVDPSWPTKKCTKGWQYDTTDYDSTAVTRWEMVCENSQYSSLVLSLIFSGTIFGSLFYGFLSDKYGRKTVFFCLAILSAVTEMGSILSPDFSLFLILLTINGSVVPSMYGTALIIFVELVSPKYRSQVNLLVIMAWTAGLCLLPLIAWLTRDWVRLSIVVSSFSAALILYWKLLPESPRWLISEKRYDEAHVIIAKISKINGKTFHEGNQLMQKIEKLGEKIQKEKMDKEKHSPLDFFKYPVLRKRFLLITFCWIGNSIPYYGLQINVKNLAGNEFLNFFLVSLVEVPAHFCTWILIERIGRRWCSILAYTVTAIACLMPVISVSNYDTMEFVASLIAKAGTGAAFMVLYQQSPELFPTSLRSTGIGLSSTIGTGSTLIGPYIIYSAKYGASIPFFIFFIISFLSAICAFFLPETLNKKLPQTIADVENFDDNFKFFSCSASNEDEAKPETTFSNWIPAALSAENLRAPFKRVNAQELNKNDPILIKISSFSYGMDINAIIKSC